MMKTLLFGSIGTLVESSDIQRRAYNAALAEAGLPWVWDRATYAELLTQAGGRERLALLAAATSTPLSAEQTEAIHTRKTELACAEVRAGIALRPGVERLIAEAKQRSIRLALVTTTYRPNVDAIFAGVAGKLDPADFTQIIVRGDVPRGKPAPDAYLVALERLAVSPTDTLAIEDTATSVMAAKRAGIRTVATPGAYAVDQDFWQADLVLDALVDERGEVDARLRALLA